MAVESGGLASGLAALPGTLLAHGVSSQEDLPLPYPVALAGGGAALVVSFVALGLLWRRPRLQSDEHGFALPGGVQRVLDAVSVRAGLRGVGLVVTGFVAVPALFAPRNEFNPTADVLFVLFWVGLVVGSLLVGPVWKLFNPLRSVASLLSGLLGVDPQRGLRRLPARLGYWPAAAGLAGFAWFEVVYPDRRTVPAVVGFVAVYAAVQIAGGVVYGQRWFDRGDAFEVYSTLLGRLALLGRRGDGRLALRAPLRGVAATPVAPGLVAVVSVLLGGTAFDALTGTSAWEDHGPVQPNAGAVMLATVVLAGMFAMVAGLFLLTCWLTAKAAGRSVRDLAPAFAHTIVPIIAGYALAHYLTLLLYSGQQALILLSDPLQTGADLFGLTGRRLHTDFLSRPTVATVQITAILTGHVLGVIAAHDKALVVLPRVRALIGQLPLLALMVVYTVGGIGLLYNA